jgi:RNA polymerase sigma-70 factor (ECF subfamily)
MAGEPIITREKILIVAQGLPAAPRVFAELERLLTDPETTLEHIADALKLDTAMSAQVIRLSNSVALGGDRRVGSVEEAVLRVGHREVFRIAGYVAGSQLAEQALEYYGIEAEPLRAHMVYTAFLCEELAEDCGLNPRAAYTAGLLRPIGLFVCNHLARLYGSVLPYEPTEDRDYRAWEGRLFGIGSNDVAALVLEEWRFPEEIVLAVRGQYEPDPEEVKQRLAALLNLVSGIVTEDGYGFIGETKVWGSPASKLATLGLNPRMLKAAINRARDAFARFQNRVAGENPLWAPNSVDHEATETTADPAPPPPVAKPAAPAPASPAATGPKSCDFPSPARVVEQQHYPQVQSGIAEPLEPIDFTTFMRNYQDMVYSTAVRLIGNETQAEDIAQDVFIKAHEHFENLKTSPTAGGWLKTVATNLSINHIQRYKKRWSFFSDLVHKDDEGGEKEVEFAAPDSFFSGVDAAERREWVERALEKLPPHQRVPLVLYHFEDMPYDEIAKKTGVSLSKVKTDILRGREALAKVLMRSGAGHEQFET